MIVARMPGTATSSRWPFSDADQGRIEGWALGRQRSPWCSSVIEVKCPAVDDREVSMHHPAPSEPRLLPGSISLGGALKRLSEITLPSEARSIAAGCVARRLNTPGIRPPRALPAARLVLHLGNLISPSLLILLDCILTGSSVDDLTST